jgi:2-hydroxychromene-2-carboxylate isomerase
MHFRFYYDIVCPYAYLASLRVEAMAARTGAHIQWCPVLLGGLYRHHGTDDVPAHGWPENKVSLGILDLIREAQSNGAPFLHNPRHPQRSVTAMRLIVAASDEQRIPLSQALYRAYWVDNQDINDPEVLDPIASAHGVDPQRAELPEIKEALRERTAEAAEKGIFGVPTFEVDEKLWWGQDRMHLVEKALGGSPLFEPSVQAPSIDTILFFHDFSSPFSYLASTQIQRLAHAHGVEVVYKPTLLGALFGAIGTENIPLFTFGAAKQAYIGRDLHDWADWWGVEFNFSPTFPIRTVTPLRVAIIDPLTTDCIYRAAWVDGLNIGDDAVLQSVLDRADFDGAALIAATQEQNIKNTLRANTEEAAQRGACGVPTIAVNDELFWGQDRLNRAVEALYPR